MKNKNFSDAWDRLSLSEETDKRILEKIQKKLQTRKNTSVFTQNCTHNHIETEEIQMYYNKSDRKSKLAKISEKLGHFVNTAVAVAITLVFVGAVAFGAYYMQTPGQPTENAGSLGSVSDMDTQLKEEMAKIYEEHITYWLSGYACAFISDQPSYGGHEGPKPTIKPDDWDNIDIDDIDWSTVDFSRNVIETDWYYGEIFPFTNAEYIPSTVDEYNALSEYEKWRFLLSLNWDKVVPDIDSVRQVPDGVFRFEEVTGTWCDGNEHDSDPIGRIINYDDVVEWWNTTGQFDENCRIDQSTAENLIENGYSIGDMVMLVNYYSGPRTISDVDGKLQISTTFFGINSTGEITIVTLTMDYPSFEFKESFRDYTSFITLVDADVDLELYETINSDHVNLPE